MMAIQVWDPFREAVSLRDAMNALFQESFIRPTSVAGQGHGQDSLAALPLDIRETENDFVIKASVPGVNPDDVHITVQGDRLTIRGEIKAEEEQKGERWHLRERRMSSFQRSISLGTPVNADKAESLYEHGVLTLTLPKAEEAKPKQIRVSGASANAAKK